MATAPTPTAANTPRANSAVALGAQFALSEPAEAEAPVPDAAEAAAPPVCTAAPTPGPASVTPRALVTRLRTTLCWLRRLLWRSASRLENQAGAAVAVKGARPETWREA